MRRNLIIILISAFLLLVGLVSWYAKNTTTSGGAILLSRQGERKSIWTRGNSNAKVILTEFSDLQCPACRVYAPLVKMLHEEFGEALAIQYRHFPLSQHRHAKQTAAAAEAAGAQNKFWEMQDLLFEKQKEWAGAVDIEPFLTSYAKMLALKQDQFLRDLNDKVVKQRIEDDYSLGISSGVNATPTFFLNGVKIDNPKSYEAFRDIVVQVLSSAK